MSGGKGSVLPSRQRGCFVLWGVMSGGLCPDTPGRSPGSKRFLDMKTPKMHISSINFISFTAQICNVLHMQSKRTIFGIF